MNDVHFMQGGHRVHKLPQIRDCFLIRQLLLFLFAQILLEVPFVAILHKKQVNVLFDEVIHEFDYVFVV